MSARAQTRAVPAAFAALAVLLAATGCSSPHGNGNTFRFVGATKIGTTIAPQDRKPAGNFSGSLLPGPGTFDLSAQRGKVVVINFWASDCPPCTTEAPQFDSIYRADKGKGVTFVGIDTKDWNGPAESFVTNNKISYPIVWDEQASTAVKLGHVPAIALPFTVLVDQRGRVAGVYLDWLAPADIEPVINQVLAGR